MIDWNIKEFADFFADVEFDGVTTVFDGEVPNELSDSQLPAQWVVMPRSIISPQQAFSTFAESGAMHETVLYVAVAKVGSDGKAFSSTTRTALLDMAVAVEQWAKTTPFNVEITITREGVAAIQYEVVRARVSSNDDI